MSREWAEDDNSPKSKFEAALAGGGSRLYDDEHNVGLGSGLQLDLHSLLQNSIQARAVLPRLTSQERFVLLGYFLLKKPQCLLGTLVGLNECRIKQFLDLTIQRFTALTAFCYLFPEDFDGLLVEYGYSTLKVKPGLNGKIARGKDDIEVSTAAVLHLLEAGKGWLQIEQLTSGLYSDLRRKFESAAEELRAQELLMPHLLGVLMMSRVTFAAVKEGGASGRMRELVGTRDHVLDPAILGQSRIRVQDLGETDFFYKRSVFANPSAEASNEF